MKTFYIRTVLPTTILLGLMLIPSASIFSQFQMNYGTQLNNSFSKVIPDGTEYFVLGQDELSPGSPSYATVTRLDAQGNWQWTLTMDIPSVWNDAVLVAPDSLLVVGSTLPFDPSAQSLMAVVAVSGGTGTFACLQRYNEQGRDAFNRIVKNPVPDNPAFPYYVLGTLNQPGTTPTTDDVVLLTVDANCNILWRKSISTSSDDEWSRDLEAMPNGDLLLAGNGAHGLIFITDNAGTVIGGVQVLQENFVDIAKEASGGVYAAANSLVANEGFIMKFDQNLLLSWHAKIPQLTSVRQIWEASPGIVYVTGRGFFGGANRDVIIKLSDIPPFVPSVIWVKYLNAGSGYTGGTAWHLPPNGLAFSDARVLTGGFGGNCAFLSVSDLELNTCMVSDTLAELNFSNPFPEGPIPPFTEPFPIPMGVSFPGFPLMWQQDTVCSNEPCAVDIKVSFLNNCGLVELCANPKGPGPYSYQWCDGRTDSCFITQLDCGSHDFCVSVTCSDGTVSTASTVVVISDPIPPTAICASGLSVMLDANCMATITAADINNGSFDNCQIDSMWINQTVLDSCGDFEVTLTVEDWCGNKDACTTFVNAVDQISPVIMCPPNVQLDCESNVLPVTTGTATATDNCDPSPILSFIDNAFGQFPCDGIIQRTWTATDYCGNMSNCVQNILVFDNVPPVLSNCPPSVTVTGTFNAAGICEADVQIVSPLATDNCDTSLVLTNNFNNTANASGIYPQGTTTVVWTVVDDCGNVDTCSMMVTVECEPEDRPPFCGWAAATCFGGFCNPCDPSTGVDPAAFVFGLVDVKNYSAATPGQQWGAPMIHVPGTTAGDIGQVFGLTIDKNDCIYLAATSTYDDLGAASCDPAAYPNPLFGPAGTGGIYKVCYNSGSGTWSVTPFMNTLSAASGAVLGTNTLPNTGPSLGNLCYDGINDKLFASNFEDGKIYRIDRATGLIDAIFDPEFGNGVAGQDNGSTGYAPLGELVWGLEIFNNRLYFSRWTQDIYGSASVFQEIWGVDINAAGFLGTETKEFDVIKSFEMQSQFINGSMPVSDITFDYKGTMVLAERGMQGVNNYNYPHFGRILKYDRLGNGSYNPAPQVVYVGGGIYQTNSAGGVALGYAGFDNLGNPVGCDSMIWGTGDALVFNNVCPTATNTNVVYGLAGTPFSGNNTTLLSGTPYTYPSLADVNCFNYFIDLDNSFTSCNKTQIGDVEILKCADCPIPLEGVDCDSLMVMYEPAGNLNDSCCWKVDLKNNTGLTNISHAIFEVITPGVIFDQFQTFGGFLLDNTIGNPNTQIQVYHPTGAIPAGNHSDIVNFCLTGVGPATPLPQEIVVTWYQQLGPDLFIAVCYDTIRVDCPVIPDKGCWSLVDSQVDCNQDNMTYTVQLMVKNETLTETFDYLVFYNFTPGNFNWNPTVIQIPGGLGPQATSGWLTFTVSPNSYSPNPRVICFNISPINVAGDFCCTELENVCITLPPCCDACEHAEVTLTAAIGSPGNNADCCWEVGLENPCAWDYFKRVEAEIITAGVTFLNHSDLHPNWSTVFSNPTELHWAHNYTNFPKGSYNSLFNFCLNNVMQAPQQIELRWIACDENGNEVVACIDTLNMDCPPPVMDTCMIVTPHAVSCNADGTYSFSMTVSNVSNPPHNATIVSLLPVAPTTSLDYMPQTFGPLNANSTATYNLTLNGNPGDVIKFYVRFQEILFPPPMEDNWCCYQKDTLCITLPPCDTCVCLGFDSLAFYQPPFTNNDGYNIPVHCNNQPSQMLPWIPNDGFYPFIGNLLCSDSCDSKVNYSVVSQDTGLPVAGGTALSYPIGNNTTHFEINPGISPIPGSYQLVLTGHCGMDSCVCRIDFIVPNCDTCACGTFSDISYRPFQGAPNINTACSDTLTAQCDGQIPWTLGGNFLCAGTGCPDTTQMTWMLMGPNNLTSGGSMTADPGFGISIPAGSFPVSGCYNLTLKALCGQDTCYCDFVIKVECPDTCCTDFDAFCQNLENAVKLTVDNDSCKAKLIVGDLPDCDYIEYVNWGIPGQTSQGPFHPGDMPMHTYPGSGTYEVCYLAIELDAAGFICFEKLVCDSIHVDCKSCCTDFDAFCQNVENATSVTVDHSKCKATLNIGDLGDCGNYIEYVDWGTNPPSISQGPFPSGSMPMHTYQGSGTYIISWLAIELDSNGFICYEKIMSDTITVMCPDCFCGGFTNIVIKNKKTGFSKPLTCNNQPEFIPCPPSGKPHKITGKLNCNGNCNASSTSWTVMDPLNNTVVSGSSTGPWFNIAIPSTAVTVNGQYMVKIQGICGSDTCFCKINLIFDGCPSDCKCDPLAAFKAEVNKGFHLTTAGACANNFIANGALTECDQIMWTVKNAAGATVGTTTIAANASTPWSFTFPGSGKYTICMKITRTQPDGTQCMHEICKDFNIQCIPIGICADPILDNHSFAVGAEPGVLGQGGTSDGWTGRAGEPNVLTNVPGSDDLIAIQLIGNCKKWGIIDHRISIIKYEPCKYRTHFNQSDASSGVDLQKGGVLVGRLSTAPQMTGACEGECEEVLRIPIEDTVDGWVEAQGEFTPNLGGDLFLTLHVENDFVEDDPTSQSALLVDYICIELDSATATNELYNKYLVHLYPNPTTDALTLRFDGATPMKGQLQIIDLWGRMVKMERLLPGGSQSHSFSITTLPAGVYFVKVLDDGVPVWVEKVVKK